MLFCGWYVGQFLGIVIAVKKFYYSYKQSYRLPRNSTHFYDDIKMIKRGREREIKRVALFARASVGVTVCGETRFNSSAIWQCRL